MILLVGAKGNMGSRYSAILRHLGETHYSIDIDDPWPETKRVKKVIIATPTCSHLNDIQVANEMYPSADILCEKPISRHSEDLELMRVNRKRLYCVNQYAHLFPDTLVPLDDGGTSDNYFKHGGDGLAWDCFQLFALAEGPVELRENSPIWKCRINGYPYSIGSMDRAYIRMIHDFLGDMETVWGWDKIVETTRKVEQWIAANEASRPA